MKQIVLVILFAMIGAVVYGQQSKKVSKKKSNVVAKKDPHRLNDSVYLEDSFLEAGKKVTSPKKLKNTIVFQNFLPNAVIPSNPRPKVRAQKIAKDLATTGRDKLTKDGLNIIPYKDGQIQMYYINGIWKTIAATGTSTVKTIDKHVRLFTEVVE